MATEPTKRFDSRFSRVPPYWFHALWSVGLIAVLGLGIVAGVHGRLSEWVPAIPEGWMIYAWPLVLVLIVPLVLYGQRVGQKAVDEGRAKPAFGMVSNYAMYAELVRLARQGDGKAQFVIWSQYVGGVALVVFALWPKS